MSARRKYELVADSKVSVFGVELFRVRALISFGCISAGDIGGYVQAEANLDHGGNAWVSGDARVSGNAWVSGDARVYGDAILQLGPIGSRGATLTATFTAAGEIQVATGCFTGSLERFAAAVETTHDDSDHGRNYRAAIEFIRAVTAGWPKPEADAAKQPQQVAA